jgi:LPS export ABC transporter protein LptC
VAAVKEPIVSRILSRLTTWFPVVLLSSLAMLTYWLDSQVQRGDRGAGAVNKEPDYYLEDFAATRFGKDGSVVQQLAAKKLTHYPDGVPTEVLEPQLVNTPPGKARDARSAPTPASFLRTTSMYTCRAT